MELRLLGPVQAQTGTRVINLGVRMQRFVLAVLALETNRLVTTDRLIDLAWSEAPPRTARRIIHSQISRLRATLSAADTTGTVTLRGDGPGYVLHCPPELIDVHRFSELLTTARHSADDQTRLRLLDEALALWRGPALADIGGEAVRALLGGHLEQARLAAGEQRLDALLRQGELQRVIEEAGRLAAEHPDRPRFVGHLMRALRRAGRTVDALNTYQQAKRRLAEEYGLDPPAELRELETAILRGDPGPAPRPPSPTATVTHRPMQLPRDLSIFTGRVAELGRLHAMLPDAGNPPAPIVVAIDGMAGVGKTKLAVHAAHRLVAEGRFADGQLYVDLGAYSATGGPADPLTVLESFLWHLGVPPGRVPADLAGRASVFRDRLATRHVLVVLDNAEDESQVAPLLPASATCMVIVTSRRTLALEGSHAVQLEVFPDADCVRLLSTVVGVDRVAAEPQAAIDLARGCGGLPLAVAIAAHRLRSRPSWPIAYLVARLGDQNERLDALTVGSRTVEAVFALSYQALEPTRRRLFRLLGVHPGNDVTVESVAVLIEADPAETEDALESLLDEHLLQQAVPGRYHLHDLLRAYAVRLCRTEDVVDVRQAAVGRLINWYLHATDAATRTSRRFTVPVTPHVPGPKVPTPSFDATSTAQAWLDAEYNNLIAVIRSAAAGGWHGHAVLLPHLLHPYFVRRARHTDWLASLQLALGATRDLGDRADEAHTLTALGQAYSAAGDTDRSLDHLQRALALHRQLDQRHGEAITLNHLGVLYRWLNRHSEAIEAYRSALGIFRTVADQPREYATQSNLSIDLYLVGRHEQALDQAQQALALQQRLGDRGSEASLRTNLGLMFARLGRHEEAIEHSQRALALHRALGSLPGEANTLENLALSYSGLGRHREAIETARRAVDITHGLDAAPEAEATALNALGEAYRLAGDILTGRRHHERALAIATAIGHVEESSRARAGILAAGAREPGADP